MAKGNLPDYRIGVLNKMTDRRGVIGAGWKNDDGSISLVFNPCVVIDGNNTDLAIRLFDREETEKKFGKTKKGDRKVVDRLPTEDDYTEDEERKPPGDDIPF